MASSLLDFLGMGGGGLQPTGGDGGLLANFNGAGTSYGDVMSALNNNRGMIGGLGLGLLSGTKYNPYGNVMQGVFGGMHSDSERAKTQMAGLTPDIKEFQYAKSTGAIPNDISFTDYQKQQANLKQAQSQYGMQGQWFQKPDGSWGLYQLNNQGQGREVMPPSGAWSPSGGLKDAGGSLVPNRAQPFGAGQPTTSATDDMGRPVVQDQPTNPTGAVPKDNFTPALDKKRAADTATAMGNLPAIEANSDQMQAQITQLKNHPGKSAAVGFIVGKSPVALGPDARDFIARVGQVQAEGWTQWAKTMRGLGALSDREGARGDAAVSRLTARDVSEKDYNTALDALSSVVETGRKNARLIASGKLRPYTPTATPGGGGNNDPLGLR